METTKSGDWDRSRILYELKRTGLAGFYALDRQANLKLGATSKAASIPHKRGEKAIAKALGQHPHAIWPSRYDAQGERLRPQPVANYEREEAGLSCQIGAAA